MPTKLNREAFLKLIDEDIQWLRSGPRTLERDHIETVLSESEKFHYDLPKLLQRIINATEAHDNTHLSECDGTDALSDVLHDEICAWIDRLGGPHGG